jgi:hypothetical protein
MARIKSNTEIPQEKLEIWKKLRNEKDTYLISAELGMNPQSVRNAFNKGVASPKLIASMEAFYELRLNALYEQTNS